MITPCSALPPPPTPPMWETYIYMTKNKCVLMSSDHKLRRSLCSLCKVAFG